MILKIFHYSPKAECKIFKAIQNASNPLQGKNDIQSSNDILTFQYRFKSEAIKKVKHDLSVITI